MEKKACDSIEEEPKCENFVIDILPEQSPPEWPECCIYRVPKQLRKVNKEAYTPKLVSIGPFHHGRKELRDMERHKRRYFKDFFELRTLKKSEKDLANIIKDNEIKIRHCYSNDCRHNSKDFVTMILLDAIFIIELFLKVRDHINDENEEEAKRKRKEGEEEDKEEDQRKGNEKEESEDEEEAQSERKEGEEEDKEEDQRKGNEKEESEDEEEAQSERKKGEEEDEAGEEEDQRKGKEKEKEDYILRKPWLDIGVRNDLILLENQLPFFVLENLYTAAICDSSNLSQHQQGQEIEKRKGDLNKEDIPFPKLSQVYLFRCNEKVTANIDREVKHFTDLVRYSYYSTELEPTGSLNHLCSATELDEAGLKFKVKGRRLLDITFPENKFLKYCPCFNLSWLLSCLPCLKCFPCLEGMERLLEVSCFKVDDSTECCLRNLMALEQCHYPFNAYICNYVSLLDDLINDEKDVALLVDKKVIVNHLGSNTAVATLINKLCTEIVLERSCYWALCQDIDKYRANPWNRIMATMKRVYFGDFWRGAATVVAFVVLVFTLWNFLANLV